MPYVTLQEASEIVFRETGIDITVPQLIRLGSTINLPLCVLLNLRCHSPTHKERRRQEAEARDPDYWSKARSSLDDDLSLADAYGLFVLPPRHVFDFQTDETIRIEYVTSLDGKDDYRPGVDRSRGDLQITMPNLDKLITLIKAGKSQGLSITATSGAPESDEQPASSTGAPRGVPVKEILSVDWPLPMSAPSLESILNKIPKWAEPACIKVGRPGKGSHLWNPAMLACCLATKNPHKKWSSMPGALTNLIRNSFPEYLIEWETHKERL